MPKQLTDLELRPATNEDAAMVVELGVARLPDEEQDPTMLAFWWQHAPHGERSMRWISEKDGAGVAYISAMHARWDEETDRFGWLRVTLHPTIWSARRHREGLAVAESWLRDEGAAVAVLKVREDEEDDLRVLAAAGYREVRRHREWELDLVSGRERLLAAAESARGEMERQGITMTTFDLDLDPDRERKFYALDIETTADIPHTVPEPAPDFESWRRIWFENPSFRRDRIWIARDKDDLVAVSVIGFPPERGVPWTSYTGTARSMRGRGIARALKYQTVAQAIALGVPQIRTENDAENAPILHINAEMGYTPRKAFIELHRDLTS